MSINYQKYVILSTYRSGTNLLTNLLNSHPQVVSHHEIFRNEFFRSTSYHWSILRYIAPVLFLKRFVFRHYPKLIKAVGFELQYDQAKATRALNVWKYIHEHKEIKIIHLKRKNQLATYLSYIVANKMRQWTTTKANSIPHYRIELGPKPCLDYFTTIDHYRALYDSYFAEHDVLTVYYEDLTKKQGKTMRKIQHFLNLHPTQTKTLLKKQNTQPIESGIINYIELKNYFRLTKWNTFFFTPKQPLKKTKKRKQTIIYIPYLQPNNDDQIHEIESLAKNLSLYPNVHINIEMHTDWNQLSKYKNITITDTISASARQNLLRECDIIIKFEAFPAPSDTVREYTHYAHLYKKMIISSKNILNRFKKNISRHD